eukprot:TRINITY_DN10460_c0_g1_i1.p1 TRINITY_DN10460_c0_g1~~TRINITY_DN10460_c0_g1_i1.p1  ORF type:complete len:568 (+),score=117.42 TRINITY_DN10460_c0_g1_i1:25-1728(+)
MASMDLHTEASALQWRARHDPAMWSLLKRAAASAAQATSINADNEAMIEGLAEDIVKRASVDATVFKLLQQAAAAAGNSVGTAPQTAPSREGIPPPAGFEPAAPAPSPRNDNSKYDTEKIIEEALSMSNEDTNKSAFRVVNTNIPPPTPPPTVPNETVRDSLHMDVAIHCAQQEERNNTNNNSRSNVLVVDGDSVVSADTDCSMPIIPIRASTTSKRKPSELHLPEPVPLTNAPGQQQQQVQPAAVRSSGQTMMEEVCTLANRPMSSEAFADRLKDVLDRYRANKLAKQSSGAPPSPLPPKVEEYDRKLSLLQAAHEAGALTFPAFKAAVEDLGTKTLLSPMPAPQREPQQVAARPLPMSASYSPMGSPPKGTITTGSDLTAAAGTVPPPIPPPVATLYPIGSKAGPVHSNLPLNTTTVPLNTIPAVPAPLATAAAPQPVVEPPKQARNISPKPRMVSPMRPPPPMSPLPQTAGGASPAVAPTATTTKAAPLPTAVSEAPTPVAPIENPSPAIPPTRVGRDSVSASQRSHSSRVLAAQRNKIPCRTPPDPGMIGMVWKVPVDPTQDL